MSRRSGFIRKLPDTLFHGGNADIDLRRDLTNMNLEESPAYGFGLYTTQSPKVAGLYLDHWHNGGQTLRSKRSGITTLRLSKNAKIVNWEKGFDSLSDGYYNTFEDYFNKVQDSFSRRYFGTDSPMFHKDLSSLAATKYIRRYEGVDGWVAPPTAIIKEAGTSMLPKEYNIINSKVLTKGEVFITPPSKFPRSPKFEPRFTTREILRRRFR